MAATEGKAPATANVLKQMLALCPDTLIGARDRALLALGFAGAFRRSELVALQAEEYGGDAGWAAMVPDQQGREGGVPGAGADRRLAPERWTDETPTAVANADAIAAVPGIDSLLIGPHDLAMGLGIPGGFADEHIVAAQQKVCDACRVHGKFAAAGFVTDETLLRRYISMGGAAYPAGQRPQHDGACRDRDRCGNAHHL